MTQLTVAQKRAVEFEGNLLVLAGAGTGKTKTLVERCLARVLDSKNPASIGDFLIVTFTEAAAAEMKERIRRELEAARDSCNPPRRGPILRVPMAIGKFQGVIKRRVRPVAE